VCIPVLERESGLKWKQDFFVGYSPERINPGDKEHTLTKILKIVSGDTPETLDKVAAVYELIIEPGVHRASSIKAAEAAKVIENTQRDLNIALMNELAIIFDKLGIDTSEVLEAAGTKWNFLKFKPGLVGGHCIGVDPYYLTHKAEMLGYHPQVILAGRRINDGMGKFIAEQTIKQMIAAAAHQGRQGQRAGPDLQGKLRRPAQQQGHRHHPRAARATASRSSSPTRRPKRDEAQHEYGVPLPWDELPQADAIVAAVAHREYAALTPADLGAKLVAGGAFIDVKAPSTPRRCRRRVPRLAAVTTARRPGLRHRFPRPARETVRPVAGDPAAGACT
jgi:UDP-N-acetyl-D-glucosamine/UDP-N-acetyl-D-galactosamine dehydrogenase